MKPYQLGLVWLIATVALSGAGPVIRRRFPQLVIRNKIVGMVLLAQGVIGLLVVWAFIAIVMLASRQPHP